MQQFIAGLSASVIPAYVLDPTTFLFVGDSKGTGNTTNRLFDQSGKGNHFDQAFPEYYPILTTDAQNVPAYDMDLGTSGISKNWTHTIQNSASGYTIYTVLNLRGLGDANGNNTYLFDTNNHTFLIGYGNAGNVYSTSFGALGAVQFPLGKVVVSWSISATTGIKLYFNKVEVLSTTGYVNVPISGGRFGGDFGSPRYAPTRGLTYFFGITNQEHTLAQMNQNIDYLQARFLV